MLAGLLPLLIVAAVVYGVIRLIGRRGTDDEGENMEGDIKEIVVRIVRLALLTGAIVLTAEGLAGLIGEALPRVENELTRGSLSLAQALSFTIVGVPSLLGLVWWTRREVDSDWREAHSIVWAAFLAGMLLVALIVTVVNLNNVLSWVLSDNQFDARSVGRTIVWGIVVGIFWRLNRQRPKARRQAAGSGHSPSHTPAYLLAGSAFGLTLGGFQLWELGRALIRLATDPTWGGEILVGRDQEFGFLAALAVVSVGIWVWFWWLNARSSARTERWFAYVLLVGVLSGVATAVSAAGILINLTLQWYVGNPGRSTAAGHFESAPGALSALIIGGLIWIHHRSQLAPDRDVANSADTAGAIRPRSEPDRVYEYLGAATGLALVAAAVMILVAQLIYTLTTQVSADALTESVANTLIDAATFALIGIPLLGLFWTRIQRLVDLDEMRSPSRRVYLIAVLGISAAATLIALVIALTVFLEALTTGDVSGETFLELRYGVGVIVSALAIGAYHALIYREDRKVVEAAEPTVPTPPKPPPSYGGASKPDRVAVTRDLATAKALLEDPNGPEAVVVTRDDNVSLADVLEMRVSEVVAEQ